jgi:hypothetical protein
MPEATLLYSVMAVVIVGLALWAAVVLTKAKEPWARPALPRFVVPDGAPLGDASSVEPPLIPSQDAPRAAAEEHVAKVEEPKSSSDEPPGDAKAGA